MIDGDFLTFIMATINLSPTCCPAIFTFSHQKTFPAPEGYIPETNEKCRKKILFCLPDSAGCEQALALTIRND